MPRDGCTVGETPRNKKGVERAVRMGGCVQERDRTPWTDFAGACRATQYTRSLFAVGAGRGRCDAMADARRPPERLLLFVVGDGYVSL